jgi:hypothetical protein
VGEYTVSCAGIPDFSRFGITWNILASEKTTEVVLGSE